MKKIGLTVIFIGLMMFAVPAQSLLKNGKIPKDLVITLERTVCFGTCPDYKLTITANGNMTFKGGHFTTVKGTAKGKITQANLKIIISEFEKSDFFKLRNSYSESSDGCKSVATDNPSEIISIKINGKKKKTVLHYFGCRDVEGNALDRIIQLGKTIDKLTNSQLWIGDEK